MNMPSNRADAGNGRWFAEEGAVMEDHEILAWVISLIGFGVPLGRMFHRAGYSPWWGLLGIYSFLGVVIAWIVLGRRDWPWRGTV